MTKHARASGSDISSRYRWRKRVSGSFRPACLSGGGRSDLASSTASSTATLSSPRRVRVTGPLTPRMSPRSRSSRAAIASSPRRSMLAQSWIRPLRSSRSRKATLPWPRRAASRPATRTTSVPVSPGSRSSCAARTAPMSRAPREAGREGVDTGVAERARLGAPLRDQCLEPTLGRGRISRGGHRPGCPRSGTRARPGERGS